MLRITFSDRRTGMAGQSLPVLLAYVIPCINKAS